MVVSDPNACAVCASLAGPEHREPLYEDELWHVRHLAPPYALPGWMMMISRRHVPGPAHFNDREAQHFGPALRHFEKVLEEVTGALRIYTAALGESSPHFHCHMVPRYPSMPKGAIKWDVFDLLRASEDGEIQRDEAEVRRISEAYRSALQKTPPPPLNF